MGAAGSLFRAAESMGLRPDWITVNGLFAVSIDGPAVYVAGQLLKAIVEKIRADNRLEMAA